ncbi:MAG: hypothetical protein CM15mV94_260 [uncultured marine virus]|nr:MAG: hypothetical protein CM15mV94_260 [uncultured marine virus]
MNTLGVEKWKTEAFIPVGTKIKNEQGELLKLQFIVDKLEALLEVEVTTQSAFPNKNLLSQRVQRQAAIIPLV